MIASTGPKISSCAIFAVAGTSSNTVGWTNQPASPGTRPPPRSSLPSCFPVSMYLRMPFIARSLATGPM
jgi:hypothetical protein